MWKEWNGKFRDDIRSFMKGDGGTVPTPHRLIASPDVFGMKSGDRTERQLRDLPRWFHAQ